MLRTGASRTDDVVWAAAVAGKIGVGSATAPGRLMIRGTTGVGGAAGVVAAVESSGLAAGSFAGGGSWTDGLGASDCCGRLMIRGTTGVGRAAAVGAADERPGLAAGSCAGGGSWTDGLGASDCCGSLALRATLAENGVAAGSWEEYAATWLALFGVTKIASIPSKGANPEGISTEAGGVRARRSAQ
jgi:hypothetical protein